MNYALALPTGGECGEARFLVALAELAEQSGWDAIFLEDYICYQGQVTPTCDTWVALGAIAARTHRVRLATAVTPLARRRPWNVAQEAVTVDHLPHLDREYPNPGPTRRAARWDGSMLTRRGRAT